jgi:ankyrin repeat protein
MEFAEWDHESLRQLGTGIRKNDVLTVSSLVERRGPVHSFVSREYDLWPLHEAAALGRLEILQALIWPDADLEAPDDHRGFTPLHHAVAAGQQATASLLISSGARVDVVSALTGDYPMTPLMIASEHADVEMIQLLLAAGARADLEVGAHPYAIDSDIGPLEYEEEEEARGSMAPAPAPGDTALLAALWSPHGASRIAPVVKLLLEAGADVNARGREGDGPLHLAARKQSVELVQLLLALGARGDQPNERGLLPGEDVAAPEIRAALQSAAPAGGHLRHATVRAESEEVPEVRAKRTTPAPKRRVTRLHDAVRGGARSVAIQEIVAAGVGLEDPDPQGRTALHLAAMLAKSPPVEALAGLGANLEARDDEGRTPLHLAVKHDRMRPARALIDHGCDLNVRDALGRTPLHLAARDGSGDMLQLLLEHGADRCSVDSKGARPADRATAQGTRRYILEFQKRG